MTNAVPKLTLLRHRGEGDISEPADIALGRIATDDELEALYRVPGRWSFLIRDPSRAIAGKGDGDTQLECLDAVPSLATQSNFRPSTIDSPVMCWEKDWRLLLWPPEAYRTL